MQINWNQVELPGRYKIWKKKKKKYHIDLRAVIPKV